MKFLEKVGFLEHENCVPYLAKSKSNAASRVDAEHRKIDTLDINILTRKVKKDKRHLSDDMKEKKEVPSTLLGSQREGTNEH